MKTKTYKIEIKANTYALIQKIKEEAHKQMGVVLSDDTIVFVGVNKFYPEEVTK